MLMFFLPSARVVGQPGGLRVVATCFTGTRQGGKDMP